MSKAKFKAKILIVEDDPQISDNFNLLLSFEGYAVEEAENGVIGLEKAIGWKPDLIISDITMPRMDGYDFLMALRENPETQLIPFIFLSARASLKDIRKGMELGALDYLTKPCGRKELVAAIESRLELKNRVQEQIRNRELAVKQLYKKIPHQFGDSLRQIIDSLYVEDDYTTENSRIIGLIIPQLSTIAEISSSTEEKRALMGIVAALKVLSENSIKQKENYEFSITATTELYTLLCTLMNTIQRG